VFVPVKLSCLVKQLANKAASQIDANKVAAFSSVALTTFQVFPSRVGYRPKILDYQAYFASSSMMEKSFITLTPWPNLIKNFTAEIYVISYQECLLD
jgi:hypothetical protein